MAPSTTLSQTLPGPLPALDGEREDGGWLFGLWPFACREQRQSCPQMRGYSGPGPSPAQPPATPLCGLGPECRPSPLPIPLPGASSWGGTRLPPPPHGASARPGLLAAGRRLPEHAPPIYRQGPPPTAISVSCQLPAAHSGRRSREPGPELSPRAGREHREPACLSAPLPVPGVLSHSPLLGAGEGPVVGCPPPSRGELGLWLQGLQAPPAAGRTGRAGAGRGTSSPQRGPRAAVA